jgi:hypothetical protein
MLGVATADRRGGPARPLAPFVLVRAGVLADPLADQPTVAMAAAG